MKYIFAYHNIALPSNIVTVLSCYSLWFTPTASSFVYLIWIKVIVLFFLIAYIHFFRPTVVFFFMNLGVGKIELYSSMVGIDLIILIITLSLVILIR